MITKEEINGFLKSNSKGMLLDFIPQLADLDIQRDKLKTLDKGTKEHSALKKTINFREALFFRGDNTMPIITKEEGNLLKNITIKATDELVEEYKKRVDEVIKEIGL